MQFLFIRFSRDLIFFFFSYHYKIHTSGLKFENIFFYQNHLVRPIKLEGTAPGVTICRQKMSQTILQNNYAFVTFFQSALGMIFRWMILELYTHELHRNEKKLYQSCLKSSVRQQSQRPPAAPLIQFILNVIIVFKMFFAFPSKNIYEFFLFFRIECVLWYLGPKHSFWEKVVPGQK